jgi:hypothetical protein
MSDRKYEKITPTTHNTANNAGSDIVNRIIKTKGEFATLSIEPSNFIAFVEFPNDGEPRANHFHEQKIEHLYLAKGKITPCAWLTLPGSP